MTLIILGEADMGNELDRRFGVALKALRERCGKSQEDFVRTGRSYLSELERGLKTPTLQTIVTLAEEIGVSATYLVALATSRPEDTPTAGSASLPGILGRAYHLSGGGEGPAGAGPFSQETSLKEVSELVAGSNLEVGRLLADAALLAFREAKHAGRPVRRTGLEFIIADKRPAPALEFTVDGTERWSLEPRIALDAARSANRTIELLDDLSGMNEVPIFRLLGMRNLSSFVGAIYVHALWQLMKDRLIVNPHQDGYPDLCARTAEGRAYIDRVSGLQQETSKGAFTHYRFGGIEVKATCGNTPPPSEGHPKPQIGDPRSHLVQSADWKSHHRSTNDLLGLYWDFIDGLPTVVGLFYCNKLTEDDWGKLVIPKAAESPGEPGDPAKPAGRTTSVSVMKPCGVKKMGKGWLVLTADPVLMKGMGKTSVFDLRPEDVTSFTSHSSPGLAAALQGLAERPRRGKGGDGAVPRKRRGK